MITCFVCVMMLVIEYVNVLTAGDWMQKLGDSRLKQYIFASFLGAIPGCLGPFTVVALYTHGSLSLGALVGAMIATSGDESFVMLAMFPKTALIMFAALFVFAVACGALTDVILGKLHVPKIAEGFQIHEEAKCDCRPSIERLKKLRHPSSARGYLTFFILLISIAFMFGEIGPLEWNWIRITIIVVSLVGLFIVITVPEHFLEEHLWQHVVKKHLLQIFLWTAGALFVVKALDQYLDVKALITDNLWAVLVIAVLVGIIPSSGPHLVFVSLFASGFLPISLLAASSISQDGHGSLPLLAHSRKDFIIVKAVNVVIAFAAGAVMLLFGA